MLVAWQRYWSKPYGTYTKPGMEWFDTKKLVRLEKQQLIGILSLWNSHFVQVNTFEMRFFLFFGSNVY